MATITLEKYGNHIGKCLADESAKHAWVNIPKNASNTISHHLLFGLKWKDNNWIKNNLEDFIFYAIIRDPIKRFIGSTIELCYHHLQHNKYNFDNFDKWFKDRDFVNFDKNVDLHFVRQIDFLHKLDFKKIKFIPLDKNFNQYLKNEFNIPHVKNINVTNENQIKIKIKPFAESLITESFRKKLIEFYAEDYELITQLNFKDLL